MKKLIGLSLIVLVLFLCGCTQNSSLENPATNNNEMEANSVFCAQDVNSCPDGTFVSRDPANNCQFKDCPNIIQCDVLNACPQEMECYKFSDIDYPICYIGDPCNYCDTKECLQAESYPPQISCQ